MTKIHILLLVFLKLLLILETDAKDKYTDENRPYEFGFNIEGEQHRHEKKDKNGIIMGEFGFITADGVYHVTVYATDKNGDFKILSMKSIRVKPFPKAKSQPTLTTQHSQTIQVTTQPTPTVRLPASINTSPPRLRQGGPVAQAPAVKQNLQEACSSCSLPPKKHNPPNVASQHPAVYKSVSNENPVTTPGIAHDNTPHILSPNFGTDGQDFGKSRQNIQSPKSYRNLEDDNSFKLYPKHKFNSNNEADSKSIQNNNLPTSADETDKDILNNNNPLLSDNISHLKLKQSNNLIVSADEKDKLTLDNNNPLFNPHQGVDSPDLKGARYVNDRNLEIQGINTNRNEKPLLVSGKMRPLTNAVNMAVGDDGLPNGLTANDMKELLYRFNYTVGFHGHHEDGFTNGDKLGKYFVNNRDGVQRKVEYLANEFGYQPNITNVELGLDSPDTPNENLEKNNEYGLKGYEFKWFHVPKYHNL